MTPAPEILDFNARAENFPVAGWFIAKHLRPAVRAYYAFARLADDIADATDLSIIKKLSALDDVEKALLNGTGSGNSADDQVHQVARGGTCANPCRTGFGSGQHARQKSYIYF